MLLNKTLGKFVDTVTLLRHSHDTLPAATAGAEVPPELPVAPQQQVLSDVPFGFAVSRGGAAVGRSAVPPPCGAPERLSVRWRRYLGKCVDSSPLVVGQNDSAMYVFAGSHAHNVACVAVSDGELRWNALVAGRVESSACMLTDMRTLAVGAASCVA